MTCTQLNTRIDIRYAFKEARYQCHFISLNIESLRTFLIFKANAKKKLLEMCLQKKAAGSWNQEEETFISPPSPPSLLFGVCFS